MRYKAQLFRGLPRKTQQGFTSVEYVLVTLAVTSALFLPIPGADGLTPVGLLMTGLRNFQLHTTYLLSMP